MVRPLVEKFGAEPVWRVGLAQLGFPPTWIHTFSEVHLLLEREKDMVTLGAKNVQNEDDIQGFKAPLPGRYHAVVKAAEEKLSKEGNPQCQVEFEVLTGTMPGQERTTITAWLPYSEKAIPQLQRFAIVTGLIQPGEGEKEVDFANAIGRQLVIEVKEDSYEGKKRSRVEYMGFWSVGNPAVADVPKDAEALKYANLPASAPVQHAAPPAQPAQQTQPTIGAPVAPATNGTNPAQPAASGKWANI